jgi:hypothetical protein
MSTDIATLLAKESEYIENHYNDPEPDPLPSDIQETRRGTSAAPRLLTIRLTAEQYERVAAAAALRDLPVSTLARNALMGAIEQEPSVASQVETALRQILKPELLRA